MQPEFLVTAKTPLDARFTRLACALLSRELSRVPEEIWVDVYQDLTIYGKIHKRSAQRLFSLLQLDASIMEIASE